MAHGAVLLGAEPKATPDAIRATMTEELEPGAPPDLGTDDGRIHRSHAGLHRWTLRVQRHRRPRQTHVVQGLIHDDLEIAEGRTWKVIGDIGEPTSPASSLTLC